MFASVLPNVCHCGHLPDKARSPTSLGHQRHLPPNSDTLPLISHKTVLITPLTSEIFSCEICMTTVKFPLSIYVISYIPMKSSEIKEINENSFEEN